VRQINAPNGVEWNGHTATSYFNEAHADRLLVYPALAHGNSMANMAELGSSNIMGARQAAKEAIAQAEKDGFIVGEDLSVFDNCASKSSAERLARQQAALEHRNYIAHCAARLEAENMRVSAQLNAGAAEMTAMTPAHWRNPVTFGKPADTNTSQRNGQIQAVDNTFKRDGGPEPHPSADDAPGDAAGQYDHTKRAADQALVDQATAEGRTRYVPGLEGRPGYMTREEHDAAGRLRDYKAIIGPVGGVGSDARKLAGQRLEDYNKSTFVGPLPADTVLGGDARSQAQARLDLQHALENGGGPVPLPQRYMDPDQATRMVHQAEAHARTTILDKLQDQLVAGGMSPKGAAEVVNGIAHGAIPQEIIDGASSASQVFAGGEQGFNRFADALPTGRHWEGFAPEAPFSAKDIEALKKIGKHIGWAGNAIVLGAGVYNWLHGAPASEEIAKGVGGWVGATELGGLGAWGGGIVAGPPGAFAGALILGTAGAFGGEKIADSVYAWLRE
jgi:hypothetical protein